MGMTHGGLLFGGFNGFVGGGGQVEATTVGGWAEDLNKPMTKHLPQTKAHCTQE